MKVIVASLVKTGTKSISACLTELDYNVYDLLDHCHHHMSEWEKIFAEGVTTEQLREMYKGVDAVVDQPASGLWEELSIAFPEAKIILTERENEDVWMKSLNNQLELFLGGWFAKIAYYLAPEYRRFRILTRNSFRSYSGNHVDAEFTFPSLKMTTNETLLRKWYRQHNAYVKQTVPKDKLLVLDMKKGWEPLCEFLGKPVPSKPFPHLNKNGTLFETVLKNHPYNLRIQTSINTSFALASSSLLAFISYATYRTYTHSWTDSYAAESFLFCFDKAISYFGYSLQKV